MAKKPIVPVQSDCPIRLLITGEKIQENERIEYRPDGRAIVRRLEVKK